MNNSKGQMSCMQVIWDFSTHFYFHMVRMGIVRMSYIELHILKEAAKEIVLLSKNDFVLGYNQDQTKPKPYYAQEDFSNNLWLMVILCQSQKDFVLLGTINQSYQLTNTAICINQLTMLKAKVQRTEKKSYYLSRLLEVVDIWNNCTLTGW